MFCITCIVARKGVMKMKQNCMKKLDCFWDRTFMPESTVFLGRFANVYGEVAYF